MMMKIKFSFFALLIIFFAVVSAFSRNLKEDIKLVEFANKNYVKALSSGSLLHGVFNQNDKLISEPFILDSTLLSNVSSKYVLIGNKTLFVFSEINQSALGFNSESKIVVIDQNGIRLDYKLDPSLNLTSVVSLDEQNVVFGTAKARLLQAYIEQNQIQIVAEKSIGDNKIPIIDLFKTADGSVIAIKKLFQYQYGLMEISKNLSVLSKVDFKELISPDQQAVTGLNLYQFSNKSLVMNYERNLGHIIWFKNFHENKTFKVGAFSNYFQPELLKNKQVLFMSRNFDIHWIDENGNLMSTEANLENLKTKYQHQSMSFEQININTPGCLPLYKKFSGVDWIKTVAETGFGAAVGVLIYANPIFALPVIYATVSNLPEKNEIPEPSEKEHLVLTAKVIAASHLSQPIPEHELIFRLVSPWRQDIRSVSDVQSILRNANQSETLCTKGETFRPLILPEIIQKIIFNELKL